MAQPSGDFSARPKKGLSRCSQLSTYSLKIPMSESDLHRIQASPCSLAGRGTPCRPGRTKADLGVKPLGSGSSIPLPGKPHCRRWSELGQAAWGPLGPQAWQEMPPAFPTTSKCLEVPTHSPYPPMSGEVPGSAHRPFPGPQPPTSLGYLHAIHAVNATLALLSL